MPDWDSVGRQGQAGNVTLHILYWEGSQQQETEAGRVSPVLLPIADYSQDEKALLGACDCSQSECNVLGPCSPLS